MDMRESGGKSGQKEHAYHNNKKNGNKTGNQKQTGESGKNGNQGEQDKAPRKPYLCAGHQRFGERCWPERCNPKCPGWKSDWANREHENAGPSAKNDGD